MRPRSLLILTTFAVAVIWQMPYGHHILYPLSLLATFAHEMGHGLSAMLVGAQFEQMQLNADGSGLAVWSGNPGRIATAFVAAGGLIGPTIAGAAMLLLTGSPRWSRAVLAALAAVLLVCMVVWSRNAFGVAYLLTMAVALALAARFLNDSLASFVVHLIAVTLCMSWFSNLDYLFSANAVVNGVTHPSDSAVMARALWLPYWFWGGVVAGFSLACVVYGIWFSTKSPTRHL
jgi:type III secretory pathway component EscS